MAIDTKLTLSLGRQTRRWLYHLFEPTRVLTAVWCVSNGCSSQSPYSWSFSVKRHEWTLYVNFATDNIYSRSTKKRGTLDREFLKELSPSQPEEGNGTRTRHKGLAETMAARKQKTLYGQRDLKPEGIGGASTCGGKCLLRHYLTNPGNFRAAMTATTIFICRRLEIRRIEIGIGQISPENIVKKCSMTRRLGIVSFLMQRDAEN
ncbi:hypothetical protein J6590_063874 [Homalodisca vitripennis]|nr:hypothetical protein J6590_063874 [Homalodisca vitripennis]